MNVKWVGSMKYTCETDDAFTLSLLLGGAVGSDSADEFIEFAELILPFSEKYEFKYADDFKYFNFSSNEVLKVLA